MLSASDKDRILRECVGASVNKRAQERELNRKEREDRENSVVRKRGARVQSSSVQLGYALRLVLSSQFS